MPHLYVGNTDCRSSDIPILLEMALRDLSLGAFLYLALSSNTHSQEYRSCMSTDRYISLKQRCRLVFELRSIFSILVVTFLSLFFANVRYITTPLTTTKTMAPLDIIIVGAGIAGPAAAIGLARNGHHVTIYERSQRAAKKSATPPGSHQTRIVV